MVLTRPRLDTYSRIVGINRQCAKYEKYLKNIGGYSCKEKKKNSFKATGFLWREENKKVV